MASLSRSFELNHALPQARRNTDIMYSTSSTHIVTGRMAAKPPIRRPFISEVFKPDRYVLTRKQLARLVEETIG